MADLQELDDFTKHDVEVLRSDTGRAAQEMNDFLHDKIVNNRNLVGMDNKIARLFYMLERYKKDILNNYLDLEDLPTVSDVGKRSKNLTGYGLCVKIQHLAINKFIIKKFNGQCGFPRDIKEVDKLYHELLRYWVEVVGDLKQYFDMVYPSSYGRAMEKIENES